MLLSLPKNKINALKIVAFFLYVMLYVLFDEKYLPSTMLGNLFAMFMIGLFIHEIMHGVAAVLAGVKIENIKIAFKLEKGMAVCMFRDEVSKGGMILVTSFPLLLPMFAAIYGVIYTSYFSLALAYLLFVTSFFDVLFLIDFIRLPARSIVADVSPNSNLTETVFCIKNELDFPLSTFKPWFFTHADKSSIHMEINDRSDYGNSVNNFHLSLVSVFIFIFSLFFLIKKFLL